MWAPWLCFNSHVRRLRSILFTPAWCWHRVSLVSNGTRGDGGWCWSGVNLSAEWWRRSSIFCMAIHDKLRQREWVITPFYNRCVRCVGTWWGRGCIWARSGQPHTPSRGLGSCGPDCNVRPGFSALDLRAHTLLAEHGQQNSGHTTPLYPLEPATQSWAPARWSQKAIKLFHLSAWSLQQLWLFKLKWNYANDLITVCRNNPSVEKQTTQQGNVIIPP